MYMYTDAELASVIDRPVFRLLSRAAETLGYECYIVGGFVRDLFLQRPSKDIDVVVVGSGIEMAKCVRELIKSRTSLSTFKNFGTAQLKVYRHTGEEAMEIEFVGARRESYQHNSRKPIVEDGTLEDDQNRRDFTINALAICLNKSRFGQLVDPFSGIDDLKDGIIRTPLEPDITFSDDPLRMMRCVRFATQLSFQIEDSTFAALQRNADRLNIISGERIIEELNKIMLCPVPSRGLYELYRSGLLSIILPELCELDMVEKRGGRAHKNNFYHTLEVVDNIARSPLPAGAGGLSAEERNLFIRWAALLHDVGKPKSKRWDNMQGWTFYNHNYIGMKMVKDIFRRLKLPTDHRMRYVELLVNLHMRPIAIADEEVTDSAVRRLMNDAAEYIDDLMTLCEADVTSKNDIKKARFRENFRIVRQKLTDLAYRDWRRELQPCIDGNEIMQRFGLTQGPMIGTLKQCLKDAVLDNRIENSRQALLRLLDNEAALRGLRPAGSTDEDNLFLQKTQNNC